APAGRLYSQAALVDENAVRQRLDQVAYCKLDQVVQQLNLPPDNGPDFSALENEVKEAVRMAPKMEAFGNKLLSQIRQHPDTRGDGARLTDRSTTVIVRHRSRKENGWAVAETTNFHIFHRDVPDLAEQVGRVAEQTRVAMQRKWFGETGPEWTPLPCEV